MKKIIIVLLFCISGIYNLLAQDPGLKFTTNFNNFSIEVDRRTLMGATTWYLIDNKKVYGSPYLYDTWHSGTILMADSVAYEQYTIKYNSYTQEVSFNDGKDSLIIDKEVNGFSLNLNEDNKVINFVYAKQYGDKKNNRFYEVVNDNEFGAYVRFNSKTLVAASTTIAISQSAQSFQYLFEYFYYNKVNKKLTKVKANNSNWEAILNDKEYAAKVNITERAKDFNSVNSVIEFMNEYKIYKNGK